MEDPGECCCEDAVPAVRDLQDLIEQLNGVFAHDRVNVDYVKALLSAYKSNRKDWKKFAKFDPHRYTRNLIDTGNGKYNLIALCWGEGQGSSIHDHSDAHCFVKVLDGDLKETMFEWPQKSEGESEMIQFAVHDYGKDGVAYINDTMGLHRMENASHTDRTVSMHLYCPPFNECQTFDDRTGHTRKVKVTFWSKYGERTPPVGFNECAAVSGESGKMKFCSSDMQDPENN